jgi:hypothetical protein
VSPGELGQATGGQPEAGGDRFDQDGRQANGQGKGRDLQHVDSHVPHL